MKNLTQLVLLALLVVIVTSGCSRKFKMPAEALSRASNWKFYRADIQSTGNVKSTFNGKLEIVWEQSTDTKPSGPLTLSKGYLIYPGSRKKIRFYDTAAGAYSGYVRTKGHSPTGMIVYDSLGYYVDGKRDYVLQCVNLLNRNKVWTRPVKDAASGSIIVNDKLILGQTEGIVQAFDLITGELKWSFETKERLLAPPSASLELVYQPGDNGSVFVINASDGQVVSRQKLGSPILGTVAVGDLCYLVDMSGNVCALKNDSGIIVWKSSVTGPIWSAPATDGSRVYVTGNIGEVNAFDSNTGEKLWHFDAQEVIKSSPIVVGEYVLFGTMSGKLYSLKALDGTLVAQREFAGAISQSPISDGQFTYVATDDGELVCLGDTNEVAALHQ